MNTIRKQLQASRSPIDRLQVVVVQVQIVDELVRVDQIDAVEVLVVLNHIGKPRRQVSYRLFHHKPILVLVLQIELV